MNCEDNFSDIEKKAKKYFGAADVGQIRLPGAKMVLERTLQEIENVGNEERMDFRHRAAAAIAVVILFALFAFGGALLDEKAEKNGAFSFTEIQAAAVTMAAEPDAPAEMNEAGEARGTGARQTQNPQVLIQLVVPCAALSVIVIMAGLIFNFMIGWKFERRRVNLLLI